MVMIVWVESDSWFLSYSRMAIGLERSKFGNIIKRQIQIRLNIFYFVEVRLVNLTIS